MNLDLARDHPSDGEIQQKTAEAVSHSMRLGAARFTDALHFEQFGIDDQESLEV